ncbi:hypothetical protein PPS11_45027 [Pseudomonas putida S11]|nr:hypothetical protein PPS11_45027 [Pseudomonas putida S11]
MINGAAEPNSTVTLTDGSGNPIGQVVADGSGNWTYVPTTPLAKRDCGQRGGAGRSRQHQCSIDHHSGFR